MKHPFFLLLFLLSAFQTVIFAQSEPGLGLEFQQYPTGSIPGLRLDVPLSDHHALELRLGYNIVYHGDAGVHQLEEGGGFGFSPGYLYRFRTDNKGLQLGARIDFWFNTIDWKDNIDLPNEVSGTTEIMVVQPTAMAGYRLPIGEGLNLTPTLAFGFEINTMQEGEDTGEGPILLGGIQFNIQL